MKLLHPIRLPNFLQSNLSVENVKLFKTVYDYLEHFFVLPRMKEKTNTFTNHSMTQTEDCLINNQSLDTPLELRDIQIAKRRRKRFMETDAAEFMYVDKFLR